MRRVDDHWKTLGVLVPDGTSCDPDAGTVPRLGLFRNASVWIRALGSAGSDHSFVTEDGRAFDPDEAVENMQFERYVSSDLAGGASATVLKRLYYLLKPMLPRGAQLAAQRANARRRLASVRFPAWPGDDSAERALSAFLASAMERRGQERVPFLGFWPNGASWAACFTHDVETLAGLEAMGRMASIEEVCGIRSTWYVVPERYPVSSDDFAFLRDRGHEVGVHGLNHDGRLFVSRVEFERRVGRINHYLRKWNAKGFRSPALYRNPEWIPELEIRYDSSYMDTAVLEPQIGGVGMVHPYFLSEGVVELPITMPMDHHLINLLRVDPVEGMLAKFRWVVERHGLANFLYHPDYNLSERALDGYQEVVEAVAATGGGWVATAEEIADWWTRRRQSDLIREDGHLRVVGPAASDARIWNAVIDSNGGVVLECPKRPPSGPASHVSGGKVGEGSAEARRRAK
jgi:peptidoglycan/xylan/chitin deacetylase (PgdA/CDA1 family)